MLKDVRSIIIHAGRMTEILKVLTSIINDNCGNYPVEPFNDHGKCCVSVSAESVKEEATLMRDCINKNDFSHVTRDRFDNIYHHIRSLADMYLHNYANSIAHRHQPDEALIEKARVLLIIQNMLDCMDMPEEAGNWDIPDGWKHANYIVWNRR